MSNVMDKLKSGIKYGAGVGALWGAVSAGAGGALIGAATGAIAGLAGGPFAAISVPVGITVGALVGGGVAAIGGLLHGAVMGAAIGGAAGGVYGIAEDAVKANRQAATTRELEAKAQVLAQMQGLARSQQAGVAGETVDVNVAETQWRERINAQNIAKGQPPLTPEQFSAVEAVMRQRAATEQQQQSSGITA